MNKLVDTDILIDHLSGKQDASRFLRSLSGTRRLCSVVTRAELLAGMRSEEEDAVRRLLSLFETVTMDCLVAEEAARYRREFGRSHGVELPDAIIAGTALVKGAVLYTTNTKHYPMKDIEVERPY
jgi:predicted nucleic acid-binding protein